MNLSWVPQGNVPHVWPQLHKGMDAACRRNGCFYTASFLNAECHSGRCMLFIVADGERVLAGLVGRMEGLPDGKQIFRILALCGGAMIKVLQDKSKWPELACESYVFDGGPGYERLFPDAKVLSRTYELEV